MLTSRKKKSCLSARKPEVTSQVAPLLRGHRAQWGPSCPHSTSCLAISWTGSFPGFPMALVSLETTRKQRGRTIPAAYKSDPMANPLPGPFLCCRKSPTVNNDTGVQVFNVKLMIFTGGVGKWLGSRNFNLGWEETSHWLSEVCLSQVRLSKR